MLSDRTGGIRAFVGDVEFELGLAVALVVLVIFLFLRSLPATVIPSLSVPLSLVGTLAAMFLLGYSLDNLSLMALTVSTGFVVDDAIVMIENIARHVEDGEAPLEAALRGAEEIGFTIVSLTVSLIAVLIPLLFMGDVVGRLFKEFAVTLSVTIALSAVVSLTLVPMMCALLVRHRPADRRNRLDLAAERGFNRIVAGYGRALGWVLDRQGLTLLVTFGATAAMYVAIPKGFFPVQDTGVIQGISEAAQDISFSAMAARQQELADAVLRDPAVESLSSFIGVDGTNTTLNAGRLLITLKPQAARRGASVRERGMTVEAVIARLQDSLRSLPGIALSMQPVQDLTVDSTVSRAQHQFFLENPDASQFAAWVPRLVDRLAQTPGFAAVTSDLNTNGRALDMVIDRPTAARFGITPATIDNALYDAFGQRIVSTFYTQSNQYRVVMQADVADPDGRSASGQASLQQALGAIYLPSATAANGPAGSTAPQQVPLAAMVRLSVRNGPLQIGHLGQFPATSVSFNLAPGSSLDAAVQGIAAAERDIGLPDSFTTAYQGALSAFQASLSNELLLILAALVAVYVVLGVLYESFVHPLTILSTLPSAGLGALVALDLTGHGLDIIGIIGIILLIS